MGCSLSEIVTVFFNINSVSPGQFKSAESQFILRIVCSQPSGRSFLSLRTLDWLASLDLLLPGTTVLASWPGSVTCHGMQTWPLPLSIRQGVSAGRVHRKQPMVMSPNGTGTWSMWLLSDYARLAPGANNVISVSVPRLLCQLLRK